MKMKRISRLLAVLILLLMTAASAVPLSAVGLITFDPENWIYSILSYSEQGTQTLNFIKNMQREIEQAKKLYEAFEEGDLWEGFQSINGMLNRLEKNLSKVGTISDVGLQMSQLRNSIFSFKGSLDPAYIGEAIGQVQQLSSVLANTREQHESDKADAREERAAKAESDSEKAQEVSNTESQTKALSSTATALVENQIEQTEIAAENEVELALSEAEKEAAELTLTLCCIQAYTIAAREAESTSLELLEYQFDETEDEMDLMFASLQSSTDYTGREPIIL